MYLIFSEEEDAQSNEVIDRLLYHGKEVTRYNRSFNEVEIEEISGFFNNLKISIDSKSNVKLGKVAVYHRRPTPKLIDLILDRKLSENDISYPKFQKGSRYFNRLKNNYLNHQRHFYEIVLNDPNYTIGKINFQVNKLDVLKKAVEVGFDVPNTLVSGRKKELVEFYLANDNNIITKSLYNIIINYKGNKEGFWLKSYTQKVDNIDMVPDQFFPTLFQQNVEKKYELRVFFLDGKCYASAILSQSSASSQQDYRCEDIENPNRIVPFNLDSKIQSQIKELMNVMDLNTGSLDFMVGIDGKTYFLEINPIGQFGFVNSACNYEISNDIAKKMIQLHENEKT